MFGIGFCGSMVLTLFYVGPQTRYIYCHQVFYQICIYRALGSTATELCWLHQLLKDLRIFLPTPPKLWCDNVSALAIASNLVFHTRTKHIEVDYHFICECVLRKDLQVRYITTNDQLADVFTKSLPTTRFQFLRSKITLPIAPMNLRGDEKGRPKYSNKLTNS